jgi:hypothetical protein
LSDTEREMRAEYEPTAEHDTAGSCSAGNSSVL